MAIVEVKSADNTRAKRLKIDMQAYAIKHSANKFGFEDDKKILPFYAALCLNREQIASNYRNSLDIRQVNFYN